MTFATKSSNQNFITFLNKIQTTIVGDEGCDFLAILDQLDPGTLPDGGIRLCGLNAYFFQHNSLCMGSTSKRVGLQGCAQVAYLSLSLRPVAPSGWASVTVVVLPGSSGATVKIRSGMLKLFLKGETETFLSLESSGGTTLVLLLLKKDIYYREEELFVSCLILVL